MSEKPFALVYERDMNGATVKCVRWAGLKNGDTGVPFHLPPKADRSVQFAGAFGSGGGKVQFQGTNIPEADDAKYTVGAQEWLVLTNTLGALIESTIPKLHQIVEVCHQMRPAVVAGDLSESIDVYLYLR